MWDGPDGMNFLMHKTKMGLIFSFVKKSPPPNDFFATHFSAILANCKLLQQIIGTYKFMETINAPCHLTALKKNLFKTDYQGRRYKQFGVQISEIALSRQN